MTPDAQPPGQSVRCSAMPPDDDGRWHWRYLFRSPSRREGTHAGGMVIVVVVVGLLAAAC